jgi:hypothetical protein
MGNKELRGIKKEPEVIFKKLDLNDGLRKLKSLMEQGKIKLLKEMAPDLRKIMKYPDGTVKEDTVSSRVRALLLALGDT